MNNQKRETWLKIEIKLCTILDIDRRSVFDVDRWRNVENTTCCKIENDEEFRAKHATTRRNDENFDVFSIILIKILFKLLAA